MENFTYTDKEEPGIDLEKIMQVCDEFSRNPRPVAMWFVDRRNEHVQFLQEVRNRFGEREPDVERGNSERLIGYHGILGMPIWDWDLDALLLHVRNVEKEIDKELAARIYPIREPGIWVEMSDGNHIHIEITGQKARSRPPVGFLGGLKNSHVTRKEILAHTINGGCNGRWDKSPGARAGDGSNEIPPGGDRQFCRRGQN